MNKLYKIIIIGTVLAVSILTVSLGIQQKRILHAEKLTEERIKELVGTKRELKEATKNVTEQLVMIQSLDEKVDDFTVLHEELNLKLIETTNELEVSIEEVKTYQTQVKNKDNEIAVYQKKLKDALAQVDKTKAASKQKKATVKTPGRGDAPSGTTISMVATAYTAYCTGCSGITATGINLRTNPGLKLIAVDPTVIPLGTKVFVEGYGYAIAGDTGGAIKGNKIDIHVPTKPEAYKWGRRTVAVTILK